MTPGAEGEAASIRSVESEGVGVVIELWVAVGRGEQHEDHVARVQVFTFDAARRADEAAGILNRGVEALHLGDKLIDAGKVGSQFRVFYQGQHGIADQPGSGFKCL